MQSHPDNPDDATLAAQTSASFFGRDDELRRLAELARDERVVLLDGPPGVGKSTLAKALVVSLNRPRVTCELADVSSRAATYRRMLEALGGAPSPDEAPAGFAGRALRALESDVGRFVILDNADRVDELERLVGELHEATEGVVFLVTTRRQLSLPGYPVFHVGGLSPLASRELFVDRARRIHPDFALDAGSVAAIDELAETLDGVPLALELAATRVKVMSPQDMVAAARDTLSLLRNRASTPGRHASMSDAVRWSWDALANEAQTCLMACSAFQGAFTLHAAEAVCGDSLGRHLIPDVLEDLLAASLLSSRYEHGVVHFETSSCIRAFARQRLAESDISAAVEARRLAFISAQATALAREVTRIDGHAALRLLQNLQDDALQAIDDALRRGAVAIAAEILVALRWNVLLLGPFEGFREHLEACAERSDDMPTEHWAVIVATLAEIETIDGDRLQAQTRVEAAAGRVDAESCPVGWLALRRMLAIVTSRFDALGAGDLLQEGIIFARDTGHVFPEARLLERLGFVRTQLNDIDGAHLAFSEANELMTARASRLFWGESLTGLGYVELRQGRLQRAVSRFEQVVDLHHSTPAARLVGAAKFNLAVAYQEAGRVEEAVSALSHAIETWRGAGFRAHLAPALVRLGLARLETGDVEAARNALTDAMQFARAANDHHNAGIAYVERSAIDASTGRAVDAERLERTIGGIVVGADPVAFASALTLCATVAMGDRRPALPWVNKLEELLALFAPADVHVRGVIRDLRDIARAWHLIDGARRAEDAGEQRDMAHRAFQAIARTPIQETRQRFATAPSPYVRLWSARLFAMGDPVRGFEATVEQYREVLVIHAAGDWFRLGDRPAVDLTSRRPLRLIVAKLGAVAAEQTGRGLDVDDVAAAGWPGETLDKSTRRNRVYTAIRFLREMDLEDVLLTGDDGYFIAPDVAIELAGAADGSSANV